MFVTGPLIGVLLFVVGEYAGAVEKLDRALYLRSIATIGVLVGIVAGVPYLALAINCLLRERNDRRTSSN